MLVIACVVCLCHDDDVSVSVVGLLCSCTVYMAMAAAVAALRLLSVGLVIGMVKRSWQRANRSALIP